MGYILFMLCVVRALGGTTSSKSSQNYLDALRHWRFTDQRLGDPDTRETEIDGNLDNYLLVHELGSGSFGIVSKCQHRDTGDLVAIKRLRHTEDADIPMWREINILRRLRHRNIVDLQAVCHREQRLYLVFECMDTNLRDYIEWNDCRRRERARLVTDLIEGIDYCHAKEIIHRDIKPTNILLNHSEQRLKIADWGLARRTRPAPGAGAHTPRRGNSPYGAPEVLVGKSYGKPADMWAIGCIFGEFLDGQQMFPSTYNLKSPVDDFGDSCRNRVLENITTVLGPITNSQMRMILKYNGQDFWLKDRKKDDEFVKKYITRLPKHDELQFKLLRKRPAKRITAREAKEALPGVQNGS